MIFITLGSQKFQFNRLLIEIDKLIDAGIINDSVFAQIGYSDYHPKNYDFKSFLDRDEFIEKINIADVVITHGGTGAIVGALKQRKKVIAVPRLSKYEEHVDDHQLQIIEQFTNLNLIYPCIDVTDLKVAVKKIKLCNFENYNSNTKNIIESIRKFIEI
ncbi:PssE/Cps14G family polysaccharide biosynthesis glycosyltransferase [Streptococcus infantarius]|uniref:PssE/Cps14G family polysaccharide biosynthesis glycosyltransferase n=1 Tax=Streptococcus infantarius TaxID=102684 RepID=UPI0022E6EB3B|nr:PssE/Cps14G family polysaccharide biosynthesis glycosyltransferase [Streptococcus infantarius]